jgi:hypothetical protein
MLGLATCPFMPNKEMVMVKGERKEIYYISQNIGKVSTQPIFGHLRGTDMGFSFK